MKKEAGEGRGIGPAAVYKLEKLPFANPARGRGAMLAEWVQWDLNRGKVLGILESQDNTYRLLGAGAFLPLVRAEAHKGKVLATWTGRIHTSQP